MVRHTADLERKTVQCLRTTPEVGMNLRPESRVMKNRLTALGGKDRVDQDAGERLRHGGDVEP
jgi:hypothetical protein